MQYEAHINDLDSSLSPYSLLKAQFACNALGFRLALGFRQFLSHVQGKYTKVHLEHLNYLLTVVLNVY